MLRGEEGGRLNVGGRGGGDDDDDMMTSL